MTLMYVPFLASQTQCVFESATIQPSLILSSTSITEKAQKFKGLKRPYISYKPVKLWKYIVNIIWDFNRPFFFKRPFTS